MLSKMENLAINLCDAKTEINELKATLKKLKPESQDMSTQTHNLADWFNKHKMKYVPKLISDWF